MKPSVRGNVLSGVALVVAAALTVSACSSSSKSGGGTSGAGGGQPTGSLAAEPSGSTIKIGAVGSITGPQASSSNQFATVAPAWAEWVNANGGINGHKVQVVIADDGNDPAKAGSTARGLIDNDKVAAILVGSDGFLPTFDAYAKSKSVPLISGPGNSGDWYSNADTYVTATDTLSNVAGQILVAKQIAHATKFANLYCAEVAACAQAIALQKPVADKAGLALTSLAVSSTAPSYTAQCLQLQQKKVDYAQLNFASAAAAKFVQDCQAQGYNPTWGTSEQAVGKGLLQIPNATFYGPAGAFPSVLDVPAVKTFRDAMTKYAKDDNWVEGTGSYAWSGLEMLRKAISSITGAVTGQSVAAALDTIKDENLDGLLANKVTFTAGKPTQPMSHPCMFVVGIKDGKTIAPNGATPLCAS